MQTRRYANLPCEAVAILTRDFALRVDADQVASAQGRGELASTAAQPRRWPMSCLRAVDEGSEKRQARLVSADANVKAMLFKIGAKIVTHARYVIFQMAEVAVPKELFQGILRPIDRLRSRPAPA